LIDGINWVADKIGMDTLEPLSTGTVHNETVNRKVKTTSDGALKEDTLATVGDRGPGNGPGGYRREIIEYPNGKMALTPNKDTDVYLPKGSKVHNGASTYQFLKDTMSPRLSTGTLFGQGGSKKKNNGVFDGLGEAVSNGLSKVADTGKKAWQGAKSLGKKATKVIGDVWEYATNPGKLVDKVLDTFGFDFGNLKGSLFKDL
ncbi:peptidoglycan DD-metalloendopeptidase family protein, partial [Staphylococcus xylosus]